MLHNRSKSKILRNWLLIFCAFQKVLSSNVHIEKSKDYEFLKPWLGTGLLTSTGIVNLIRHYFYKLIIANSLAFNIELKCNGLSLCAFHPCIGKKWFHRRKMLTPAFHFKILDEFLYVINDQTQVLVDVLNEKFSDGKTFDVFPYITRCALDIICGNKQI